jgi:hypothetical protein
MIDYQLTFVDEAEATRVLGAPDALIYPNTDVIGVIYRATGEVVANDGVEVALVEPTTGYHANVRTVGEAPELEAYRVYPVTPVRVWF